MSLRELDNIFNKLAEIQWLNKSQTRGKCVDNWRLNRRDERGYCGALNKISRGHPATYAPLISEDIKGVYTATYAPLIS